MQVASPWADIFDEEALLDAGKADGLPPKRREKLILALLTIGGALLIVVLLVVLGFHGEQRRVPAAAGTSDAKRQPPGADASTAPSVTASPSRSARPKSRSPAPSHRPGERSVLSPAARFKGAHNVLLKNSATGLCADLPNYDRGSVNGAVNQYECTFGSADNQVWDLMTIQASKGPGGARLFGIRNAKDDLCMDVPGYGAVPQGAAIAEYFCRLSAEDNQLWYLTHVHGDRYRIRNHASRGLCLGVDGGAGAGADARLVMHRCGPAADAWSWPSGG